MNFNRIYLIGYMGSGKTTIGRHLAKEMGLQFEDLDLFIENRYRKSVQELFSEKGEAAFREIEHNALMEISGFENIVISTGGGTPCFQNNMDIMKKSGVTIYLKVPVEQLAIRLNKGKQNRPLLKTNDLEELKEYISANLEKRKMFYEQATLTFNMENLLAYKDVNTIVLNLTAYFSNYKTKHENNTTE